MTRPPHPDRSAAEAHALFLPLELSGAHRLLLERSYCESSIRLRRCAWLLCSQPQLLIDAMLRPMTTWGASSSYAPLRDYERGVRLAQWIRMDAVPGAPFLPFLRGAAPRAPSRWRWAFAGLMLAGSPLSFFASVPLAQILGHASGSTALLLLSSALLPTAMGMVERRFLFRRWPRLNPARAIVSRWIAPSRGESEACSQRALECFALHSVDSPALFPLPPPLQPVELPRARFDALAYGQTLTDASPSLAGLIALAELAAFLSAQGRDPGVDAALVVLAHNDKSALIDALGTQAGEAAPRRRARSI